MAHALVGRAEGFLAVAAGVRAVIAVPLLVVVQLTAGAEAGSACAAEMRTLARVRALVIAQLPSVFTVAPAESTQVRLPLTCRSPTLMYHLMLLQSRLRLEFFIAFAAFKRLQRFASTRVDRHVSPECRSELECSRTFITLVKLLPDIVRFLVKF